MKHTLSSDQCWEAEDLIKAFRYSSKKLRFKEMAEINREIAGTIGRDNLTIRVNNAIIVSKPFVLHYQPFRTDDMVIKVPSRTDGIRIWDLPFSVCSFESLIGPISVFNTSNKGPDTVTVVNCVLVKEVPPNGEQSRFYEVFVMTDDVNTKSGTCAPGIYELQQYQAQPIVETILKGLSKWTWGKQKSGERFRDLDRNVKKISEITHVSPSKYPGSEREDSGTVIDWSHRWWVRGHWVKLFKKGTKIPDENRLGKDRDGNFVIRGSTWRNAHIRGDGSKPILEKVRHVSSECAEDAGAFDINPR